MILMIPENIRILQLAHGKIIPNYSSAYSMRCYSLFENSNRKIISIGGPVLLDKKTDIAEQYRSYLLFILAILKGNRSFEILLSQGKYVRKKFLSRVKELIDKSDVIVYEGPWVYSISKNFLKNKIIVYDAHNVEYILRKDNIYHDYVKGIEKNLVMDAHIIFTVTEEDRELLKKIYNIDISKIFLIPHQLKITNYKWNGEKSNDIVFIGSLYEPNIIALKEIEKIAMELPRFNFHIIGNLNKYPRKKKLKNMIYHGTVNDEEKDEILNSAFLALNPVTTGSGRNVKMIDYISHGLPVLTTLIGSRGFNLDEIKDIIFIDDIKNFKKRIIEISEKRDDLIKISKSIYAYYKKLYERETSLKAIDIISDYIKNYKK